VLQLKLGSLTSTSDLPEKSDYCSLQCIQSLPFICVVQPLVKLVLVNSSQVLFGALCTDGNGILDLRARVCKKAFMVLRFTHSNSANLKRFNAKPYFIHANFTTSLCLW